jgi:hypothetical protein
MALVGQGAVTASGGRELRVERRNRVVFGFPSLVRLKGVQVVGSGAECHILSVQWLQKKRG